ncbi:MAG: adenine nucleotide alpha hydrolase [Spirochaetes bacterium]|uniref:Adenine nucleotide alpha hydrolase n=1 Tax=Candidatus Ornithospirochaeta stercoripullorum TaxID=2840899 RepID=A0A9D9H555_9SPIO|nr:adenine nucleotide alpha hydrolase [Candidatus Ornithospirochaeta stercoripullorum]
MRSEHSRRLQLDNELTWRDLINGEIPPWVMRFIKGVGKAINRYRMIQGGDDVLIAASGGKDSLALALALSLRRKWLPVDYTLRALLINWLEHPIPPQCLDKLAEYFDALGIYFTIKDEKQFPSSFDGDFNCYLCARNRRRVLFTYAEETDTKLIAMGHHLDDLAETTMMNLCFRASFSTMLPVQEFFSGKMHVIRPMIETKESVTKRLSETFALPVVKPVCPYDQTNVRARLKPIIQELSHIDKLTREHIYNAHDFSSCVMPNRTDDKQIIID